MKVRKPLFGILTALGMAMVFVLLTATNGEAQTAMQAPESRVMSARIPFDFWIGGAHLPAGDYTLDFILDTLVLFRNAGANAQEHAFFMPTGEPAPGGENKLLFVVENRQHHLQELWNANGRAVLTWRTGAWMNKEDTRIKIALSEERPGTTLAGR
jgi:hypothetical protein